MTTLEEIKASVQKLTPQQVAELRAWLEDFCEDQLELTEAVKTELDEAWRTIDP